MLDSYFNADAFDYSPTTLRLMAIEAWKDHAPVVPDGSPFQYANFGFMIAGAMMEAVTGEPWEALVRERIYEPLGLDSAGFGPTATPGLLDAAVGHWVNDDGVAVPRLWGPWADLPQIVAPAGTNHMNILDFARWADWNAGRGLRGPQLVAPATLAYIHAEKLRTPRRPNPPPGTPAEGGYAFGWSIEKLDWSDHELLTHNGSNQFNLAKIVVDEELDLAIVVATNIGGPPAHDGVERVVACCTSASGDGAFPGVGAHMTQRLAVSALVRGAAVDRLLRAGNGPCCPLGVVLPGAGPLRRRPRAYAT